MAIKLDIVRPISLVEKALKSGYLYKDVEFDLSTTFTDNRELAKVNEKDDLASLYDVKAVVNSLKNILTTSPGEKLLNPTFGLDLRDYLFEQVSIPKGYFIGEDIFRGIVNQEPRIDINRIDILVDEDEQQYVINLNISIPSLNAYSISLKGVLNNDGYTFA